MSGGLLFECTQCVRLWYRVGTRTFPDTPGNADRCRVKLAVLDVKFLKRPTAALKLLSKVDRKVLPEDFQSIHQQAARQAQQMIADGVGDAI